MFAENDRISVRQIQCILILNILSFGFFVFPSVYQGFSGLEIVLSAALGGLAELLVSRSVVFICSEKTKGLGDVFDKYTGQKAGFLIRLIFLFYLILKTSEIISMYSASVRTTSLPKTPLAAIIAASLIISLYISLKGIETLGRISEIFLVLILAGIMFVFVFASKSGGFSNITPAEAIGIREITSGGIRGLFFFQGMEILFILNMYTGEKTSVRAMDIFEAFGLAWIIITFSAFLIFTKLKVIDEVFSVWPFIKIAENIDIPFAFIERQDFIITALVTTFMVFASSLNILASGVILSDITKKFNDSKLFSCFALAGVIIVLIVRSELGVYWLFWPEYALGFFCFIVLPLILAALKKHKEAAYEK